MDRHEKSPLLAGFISCEEAFVKPLLMGSIAASSWQEANKALLPIAMMCNECLIKQLLKKVKKNLFERIPHISRTPSHASHGPAEVGFLHQKAR